MRSHNQRLSHLLERWRHPKEQASPAFHWLASRRPPPIHLGTAQKAIFRGHRGSVCGVSCSPDGRRIVSGSGDNTVRVWDAESGAELAILRGHEDNVTSVSYSPDGRRIVSGSNDHTVRVWDAESGAELAILRGHESDVTSVSYSPDSRRIVSGSRDKTVRVWDAESGECLDVIQGKGDVAAIAAGPESFPFRALGRDQEIIIQDASTGHPVARFPEALDHIVTHPNGRSWAGRTKNRLHILTLEGGDEIRHDHEHDTREAASNTKIGTRNRWWQFWR